MTSLGRRDECFIDGFVGNLLVRRLRAAGGLSGLKQSNLDKPRSHAVAPLALPYSAGLADGLRDHVRCGVGVGVGVDRDCSVSACERLSQSMNDKWYAVECSKLGMGQLVLLPVGGCKFVRLLEPTVDGSNCRFNLIKFGIGIGNGNWSINFIKFVHSIRTSQPVKRDVQPPRRFLLFRLFKSFENGNNATRE